MNSRFLFFKQPEKNRVWRVGGRGRDGAAGRGAISSWLRFSADCSSHLLIGRPAWVLGPVLGDAPAPPWRSPHKGRRILVQPTCGHGDASMPLSHVATFTQGALDNTPATCRQRYGTPPVQPMLPVLYICTVRCKEIHICRYRQCQTEPHSPHSK